MNYFLNLFSYHDKANTLVIEKLYPENPEIDVFAYKMLHHILLAQHVWLRRILKRDFDYAFGQALTQEEVVALILKNKKELEDVLSQFEMEDLISFTNLQGEKYTMKLIDILTHVSHHSSYHRGQIIRTLRLNGIEPPATDYALFNRR